MTELYRPKSTPVEHLPTKYDDCVLRSTGKEYRNQTGSGRSEMLAKFAKDGKRVGDIAKEAAAAGFETNFVVSSILKHEMSPKAAWVLEAPEGTTLEAIKKQRQERRVSPEAAAKRQEQAAAREAKAKAKADTLAQRETAKADAVAAREKAKTEKEAAKAKAAEERAAAKAAAGEKPKGKGKAKPADGVEQQKVA